MKNIFVLFSPGTGGNHLANMLSTDNRFTQRSNLLDYKTHVSKDAHTSNIKNLQHKDLEALPETRNVLCGHFGEYRWISLSGLLNKFDNRQIFNIEVPIQGSVAWQRYTKLYPLNRYWYEEQRSLYTIDMIETCFAERDIISVPCELLFRPRLNKLFDYISSECDIVVDKTTCASMHKIWYKKIINQNKQKG